MDSGDWLNTSGGRNLLREEVRQVRKALEGVFGDQFLQVGTWGDAGLFRRLARTRRTAICAESPTAGADLVSAFDSLSIASDSVDAVLLPHTLEYAADPHALLREVDRVLRQDGHLVVLGFNPFGWWGLRHAVSRRQFPLGARRMISQGRLCDWLQLLDFQVRQQSYYHFAPPVIRRSSARRAPGESDGAQPHPHSQAPASNAEGAAGLPARRRSPAGGRSARLLATLRPFWEWRGFAGCYVLAARRQVVVVTPIRLAWRRRTALVGGLVNPTTRNVA
jgi:SAM-dependent methyltransferase